MFDAKRCRANAQNIVLFNSCLTADQQIIDPDIAVNTLAEQAAMTEFQQAMHRRDAVQRDHEVAGIGCATGVAT